jgi:hypothetical protein
VIGDRGESTTPLAIPQTGRENAFDCVHVVASIYQVRLGG